MINICEKCGESFYIKKHRRKQCYICRPKLRFNSDALTKICIGGCNKELPNTSEYFKKQGKHLSPWCRNCTRENFRDRQNNLKKLAIKIYGHDQCHICGYNDCIASLTFHHLDPTRKDGLIKEVSIDKLKAEISKCILVCFNCHQEIHGGLHSSILLLPKYSSRRQSKSAKILYNKKKQERINYKGGKCIGCGYKKFNGALTFHHKDPSQKDFGISQKTTMPLEEIKTELDKCILLCFNCHMKKHYATSLKPSKYSRPKAVR